MSYLTTSLRALLLVMVACSALFQPVTIGPVGAEVAQAASLAQRVNAGGGTYRDAGGRTWSADRGFHGGRVYAVARPIANTASDGLYRTERFGDFSYRLAVAKGTYRVTLRFAEVYWTRPGQRVFDVAIEGRTVLNNFDILRHVAPRTALARRFSVSVSDGYINLRFRSVVDYAKVSAIEVRKTSATTSTYFRTLPPGSALPSGATCAARVRRHPWEPRPQNYAANLRTGRAIKWITGANSEGNRRFAPRVDGAFTGTTDEIIQWGACKWGLDEDVVRAIAVRESWWVQSHVGDNGDSFGLIQIRSTVHPHAYPMARTSTAFNVDYGLSWWRSCYEGYFDHWIPAQARGDQWGCNGLYYSGRWKDAPAREYIAKVRQHLAEKDWIVWGHPGR